MAPSYPDCAQSLMVDLPLSKLSGPVQASAIMKFPAGRHRYRSLEWVVAVALVLAGGQFLRGVAQSYCTVSISPTSTTISSAGGTVSFNAYTNCALSIFANNSWLHALISSLPGSGMVQATVDANSSASSRTGTSVDAKQRLGRRFSPVSNQPGRHVPWLPNW